MNGILKIGFIAAGIFALVWVAKAAQDFAYKIVGYGIPSIDSHYRLTLPVKIRFNNPTPLTIQVDNVRIDVYLLKEDLFQHVGQVSTPITLEPGASIEEITPQINLQSIFSDLLQTFKNALHDRTVTLRTDVTVTFKGITLPVQSSTEIVQLS